MKKKRYLNWLTWLGAKYLPISQWTRLLGDLCRRTRRTGTRSRSYLLACYLFLFLLWFVIFGFWFKVFEFELVLFWAFGFKLVCGVSTIKRCLVNELNRSTYVTSFFMYIFLVIKEMGRGRGEGLKVWCLADHPSSPMSTVMG